ncbi:M50 family metallopeptidase [Streptomyces sp. CA-106131]
MPYDVLRRSSAVHEAAHALLAWVLGLEVERLSLAKDRTTVEGGGCSVTGTGDAQHYTLVWLSAGYASCSVPGPRTRGKGSRRGRSAGWSSRSTAR